MAGTSAGPLGALTPVVSVRGLQVRRGRTQVFDGLDLDIAAGRLTGLLGPSGCGKSTLIRAIVGLQRIQAGQVQVGGLPAGHPDLRRRLNYSSQADGVYLDLTVSQNVAHFARLAAQPSSEVERVIQAVDLSAQARQLAGRLSGGQLRRVSLAIALIGAPELIVLDEPTVGLDPVLRVRLWDLFADLAAQGASVLVSSHVMDEASRCDDLLLLRAGHLVAACGPADLLARTGQPDAERAFLELIRRDRADRPDAVTAVAR
ncbi:MAG: ABC transporter ATP-binding protein [Propionibacteriaceae bacterium]|jgi:ABC-2 type transport system ATP-binding protein|nr:ABC transporter ATP-binding protein [Propionibacteriaceae bacterium]